MLKRRILVLVVLSLTVWIFAYLPYRCLIYGYHGVQAYLSPREQPDALQKAAGVVGVARVVETDRVFCHAGQTILGRTNNDGNSIAVAGYEEGMEFKARHKDIPLTIWIRPHREGQKLVLVYVLMANDSKDDDMTTHVGYFTLKGKREYPYDIDALRELKSCGIGRGRDPIAPGEETMAVAPFSVDADEDVSSMSLSYCPWLFTPTITVPMTAVSQ